MISAGLLDRRVAIVAGGGRGIGAAISLGLAAAGAAVAVLDLDGERAEAIRDEIEARGGEALVVEVDLLEAERVDLAMLDVAERFGRLDALVNVAGGMATRTAMRPLHEWTREDWDLVRSINLDYTFSTCRAALEQMLAIGSGSIVNVASLSGLASSPRHAPYGAAKAALMSLTRSLAVEYGHHGIRVNAVAPGSIATPAIAEASAADLFDRSTAMIPLGRRGTPDDVARAVVFLTSELASYVTGQVLAVDGGASLRFPLPLPDAHLSEAPEPGGRQADLPQSGGPA